MEGGKEKEKWCDNIIISKNQRNGFKNSTVWVMNIFNLEKSVYVDI